MHHASDYYSLPTSAIMKLSKYLLPLFFVLSSLLPIPLCAEIWTPENLPMVHLQDSTRFVCNPDGVLSPETVAQTDAILRQLKRTKGVETVVVVVKKIENGDPYQFGMDLSRKYGIGDKEQRTGLIVILSTEDRAYQFLTGNGLEGTLPDGLCYNIQQEAMLPYLKQGDWDKAIYESVVALNGVIMGDESITRRYTDGGDDDTLLGLGITVAIVIFIVIFSSISESRKRRCPKCKTKNGLEQIQSRRVRIGNSWYTKTTWKCKKCGHIVVRNEEDPSNNSNSSGGGFPLFGGGGSHSSGGFGGGSFGGGSFGGGGSGGRF